MGSDIVVFFDPAIDCGLGLAGGLEPVGEDDILRLIREVEVHCSRMCLWNEHLQRPFRGSSRCCWGSFRGSTKDNEG